MFMLPFYIYIVIFSITILSIYGLYKFSIKQNNQIKMDNSPQYTFETLIGKTGKVVKKDGEDGKYLGYLNDISKTPIIVKINTKKVIKPDTDFIIKSINGSDIMADIQMS